MRGSSPLAACVVAVVCAAACGDGEVAGPEWNPRDPTLDRPATYVAKIKNVLVGLPPTDDEVRAVEADPAALGALVDQWMTLPQYRDKLLRFFQLAFQQTQVAYDDYDDQVYPRSIDPNGTTWPRLIGNSTESFARTAIALIDEGRPFNETMWTDSYMMTPALMEFHAFLDAFHVDDAGKLQDRVKPELANVTMRLEPQTPIPLEQSLDPASPNYMVWFNPDITDPKIRSSNPPGCDLEHAPYAWPAPGAITIHWMLQGGIDNRYTAGGLRCFAAGGSPRATQLVDADFASWRMVRVRQPKNGEEPTRLWDIPKIRASNELVLRTPRAGFFSTPAFHANWKTNQSNQMRVTTNQALIVATGAAIDTDDTTKLDQTPGLDAEHADPKLGCVGCHRLLDPTRSILQASWTTSYHDQLDRAKSLQNGIFAFRGVVAEVGSVSDFGHVLGTHPLFARAWVQKLSYWTSSRAFDADDPELARIAADFESSGFSWPVLVRELMTSPFTTNAAHVKSTDAAPPVVSVARRDHICAAWAARLGVGDVCGLGVAPPPPDATVPAIVKGFPSDGYGRGAVAPVLPAAPTLFYRTGTENACVAIAQALIDPAAPAPPGARTWSSGDPAGAIADFVHLVMGMPDADPREAKLETILKAHFQSALDAKATRTDALRSTFAAACTAPSATGVGL